MTYFLGNKMEGKQIYKKQFKIGCAERREAHQILAMRFLTSAASYKLKISASYRVFTKTNSHHKRRGSK